MLIVLKVMRSDRLLEIFFFLGGVNSKWNADFFQCSGWKKNKNKPILAWVALLLILSSLHWFKFIVKKPHMPSVTILNRAAVDNKALKGTEVEDLILCPPSSGLRLSNGQTRRKGGRVSRVRGNSSERAWLHRSREDTGGDRSTGSSASCKSCQMMHLTRRKDFDLDRCFVIGV